MKILKYILAIGLLLPAGMNWAQNDVVVNASGEYFSCGGAFLDSGGQGGTGYSNNENFTVTICPDTPGDVVTVDFVTFNLDNSGPQNSWDSMAIYDGDNTGAGTLGSYTQTQLQGLFVTATPLNTTGCLTFVFQSNGTGTGNFGGTITCETPCDRPTAVGTYDAPANKRICVGEVINFDGTGSFAAPGFNITEYLWDFADGTTYNGGPTIAHSWDEPGEYIVELYLQDDNGCASTNRISLQVLVATYPSWDPFPNDTTLCLGEDLCLSVDPDAYEVTWAGPEISYSNAEDTPLPDNVGECFTSEIEVAGFAPGQQLENIADLISVDIAVEHSWLFDLVISVSCPSGESVILHQQMSDPNGGQVGSNGTDLGVPNTEYYDYSWAWDAPLDTWAEEASAAGANTLAEGIYSSLQPMDQLVGCELNGTWAFEVCDLWGGDDGELSSWGLNFNPAIIPDVTEFTPDIGADADSSFWSFDTAGLNIISESADGNEICFAPEEPGVFEFTYSVTNNHGCSHDSTVVVTCNLAAQADAGPDVTFCGEDTQLQGGLDGIPTPQCSTDGGDYTYCYGNNENTTFTYCPDNPGDGAMMSIVFEQGETENFFDQLVIFDGDNTGAPVLDIVEGDLTGLVFTATNPGGCITMQITSDGSVSCDSGSETEWAYEVTCDLGGPDYTYEWSPVDGLSDPNIPNPTILEISGQTTYTLTVFPTGHPDCFSVDQVDVNPAFDFVVDNNDPSCFGNDGWISVNIDAGTGVGPWEIEFFEEGVSQGITPTNGGLLEFTDLFPGNYSVSIGDATCTYENDIVINAPAPVQFEVSNDSLICVDGSALLQAWSSDDPDESWTYTWDGGLGVGNQVFASPDVTTTYSVFATDDAGCDSDPLTVEVSLRDSISVTISGTELICQGTPASLQVDDVSGGLGIDYNYEWLFNGSFVSSDPYFSIEQFQTGTYCLNVSDQCESPTETECIEVVVETPLNVAFEADTTQGCMPAVFTFHNLIPSTDYATAQWDFGDGWFGTAADSVHTYDNAGFYDVGLTLTTALGCQYSASYDNYISVFNIPEAGFYATPQPTTMPDTEISFFDLSVGNVQEYFWVFDTLNVQGTSTEPEPVFEFPINTGGLYPVSLTVTDNNNCSNQLTRFIVVNDLLNVYVPNSFTPNNDGVNDVFRVEGTDIDPDRFEIIVFNRWGDKVYESAEVTSAWNGAHQNGQYYCEDGVYVWRMVVHSLATAERYEYSGTITLLRQNQSTIGISPGRQGSGFFYCTFRILISLSLKWSNSPSDLPFIKPPIGDAREMQKTV